MKGEGQVEAVNARGLQNYPCMETLFGNHADQFLVTRCIVRQINRLSSHSLMIDDRGEGLRADIESDMMKLFKNSLLVYPLSGFPDPASSPTRLVNPGSRASDTLRHW